MKDTKSQTTQPQSFVDQTGALNVPEAFAQQADRRAFEIFEREAAFNQPFKKCLGQIYMVGVQAGILAARSAESHD